MFRRILSTVVRVLIPSGVSLLQVAGLALTAFGFYTLAPALGLIIGGLALCGIGWTLDTPGNK